MKMINRLFAGSAVVMALMLGACSMETQFSDDGEGLLFISPVVKGEVTSATRAGEADVPSDPKESFTVWIIGEKGVMKRFKGVDNIPESFSLKVGSYVADAWAGDSVSASFDRKFYRAFQPFDINKGVNQLNVICKIANVVVSVDPESLNVSLKDMTIKVANTRGELVFDSENAAESKGYFMMPNDKEKDLEYTIEGTTADGLSYKKEGAIEGVQRAHEYRIKLTEGEQKPTQGGALIKVTIVDTPIIDESIDIFPAPAPRGLGFDITEQIVSETRDFTDKQVYVRGYHGLRNVSLKFSDNFNFNPSEYDALANSVIDDFRSKGINIEKQKKEEDVHGTPVTVDELYVTFTKAFLDALPESANEYVVEFSATDGDGHTGIGALRIANSIHAIEFLPPVAAGSDPSSDPLAIGARSATLTGVVQDQEKALNYGIEYRKSGASDWIRSYPARSATTRADIITYSVSLSGLEPATTYEYRVFCDGYEGKDVIRFTTESIFQIANASFEDWDTYSAQTMLGTKTVIIPWSVGDKSASFWGSGNEGAATANMTLTDKSSDMLKSGSYSARLESKSALGMLAAGNIFIGEYVKTDGTNGVLSVGRPYNGSHPSKLRLYANYRPGTDVKIKSGNEEFTGELAGAPNDQAQIYVALTTEPVEIRTNPKSRKLFYKTDSCVIAYGQVTWKEAFGPDGALEMVEIPIEYNANAKINRPTHLVIVASASKFGDYFSGSAGSVMYLDDFELIYE